MKKLILLFVFALASITGAIQAQVTIGSNIAPDNNALLDIKNQSDGSSTKGLLMPRVALTATTAAAPLLAHVEGMTVYNTATAGDVTPGYYYNDGSKWVRLATATSLSNFWSLTGNAGTTAGTNFLGTTDDKDLMFKRNNIQAGLLETNVLGPGRRGNTAFGTGALMSLPATATLGNSQTNSAFGGNALTSNTSGSNNNAFGLAALYHNTTGSSNSAFGFGGLQSNTTGSCNTSYGHGALTSSVAGSNGVAVGYYSQYNANNTTTAWTNNNTSVGYQSLYGSNTPANNTGTLNTALGYQSLMLNSSGSSNTANGAFALSSNATGNSNTVMGASAMFANTTGNLNTGIGQGSLSKNTSGSDNVAVGQSSLYNNTTATANTAVGTKAMYANTIGYNNTASGHQSLNLNTSGYQNTAVGMLSIMSNTTGSNNTALGYSAGDNITTGSNNIAIGANTDLASAVASNQLNIGNAIFGTELTGNVGAPAGKIGIGITNPDVMLHVSGTTIGQTIDRYTTLSSYTPALSLRKSKSDVTGTQAALSNGDYIGALKFIASDGSSFAPYMNANVQIVGYALGDQTTTNHGGVMAFWTTAQGETVIDERMKLTDKGLGIGLAYSTMPQYPLHLGGGAYCNGTTWVNASDARLKTNITNSTYGLAEVLKLRPVNYNMKSTGEKQVGLIAQEVQKIIPEVVSGKEGDITKGETLGLSYQNLVPVLINAIKELQAEVEQLKTQINNNPANK